MSMSFLNLGRHMKSAFLLVILMVGSIASAETYTCYEMQDCFVSSPTCSIESLRQGTRTEKLAVEQGVSARISYDDSGLAKKILKFVAGDDEGYVTALDSNSRYSEYRAYLRVFRTLPLDLEFLRNNIWADDGRVFVSLFLKLEDPISFEYVCEKVSK